MQKKITALLDNTRRLIDQFLDPAQIEGMEREFEAAKEAAEHPQRGKPNAAK